MISPTRFFKILSTDHSIETRVGETFYWDPNREILFHKPVTTTHRVHSFAHELGHAVSRHQRFYYDLDLLLLEREAWHSARDILNQVEPDYFQPRIAQKHLGGYVDWLTERSRCSQCLSICLQRDDRKYLCHNCGQVWCFALGEMGTKSETVLTNT